MTAARNIYHARKQFNSFEVNTFLCQICHNCFEWKLSTAALLGLIDHIFGVVSRVGKDYSVHSARDWQCVTGDSEVWMSTSFSSFVSCSRWPTSADIRLLLWQSFNDGVCARVIVTHAWLRKGLLTNQVKAFSVLLCLLHTMIDSQASCKRSPAWRRGYKTWLSTQFLKNKVSLGFLSNDPLN